MTRIQTYYSLVLAEDSSSSKLLPVERGIIIRIDHSWISYKHNPKLFQKAIKEIERAEKSEPDLYLLYTAASLMLIDRQPNSELFDPAFLRLREEEAKLIVQLFLKRDFVPEARVIDDFVVIRIKGTMIKFFYIKTSIHLAILRIMDMCKQRDVVPYFSSDGDDVFVQIGAVTTKVDPLGTSEELYIYNPAIYSGKFDGEGIDVSLFTFRIECLLRFEGIAIDLDLARREGIERTDIGFKITSCLKDVDKVGECLREVTCGDREKKLVFVNNNNLITLNRIKKEGEEYTIQVDIYHHETPQIFSSWIESKTIRLAITSGDVPLTMLINKDELISKTHLVLIPTIKIYDRESFNQFVINLIGQTVVMQLLGQL